MRNMKKALALLLAAIMIFGLCSISAGAAVIATPTAATVLVNGEVVAFDAYNIDGANYFKLRDLAYALSGSEKSFEVTWDGDKNAINLLTGELYSEIGGELAAGDGQAKDADLSTAALYVDGAQVALTAYNIGGANYFKLRDVMKTMDVVVRWDGDTSTITLTTAESYVDPNPTIVLPLAISNKTGVDIVDLRLSPATNELWGDNLLGDQILTDGAVGICGLVIDKTTLKWDLKVADADGTELVFRDIDFSSASVEGTVLVLTYDFDAQVGVATLVNP